MACGSVLQQLIEFDHQARLRSGSRFLFGTDEAGRGPLAGPVVAGAVLVLDTSFTCVIGDSKKLSARQRETAFAEIHARCLVGVAAVSEKIIDEINILKASHLAMSEAVKDLLSRVPQELRLEMDKPNAGVLLVDGNLFKGDVPFRAGCVVKGDSKSLAIACASIVAKVTRDHLIEEYDKVYPQYGFKKHKGYPTAAHRAAIKQHGLLPIHRKTFTVS
ncbi:MAG: ribonuclease HII [Candidatus Omnitrophica bacterium]|nr:ribonuclease HII [Candidatus Omnitrophota bacterium]